MKSGQRVVLRPWASRYQLAQPPVVQTVRAIRALHAASYASTACSPDLEAWPRRAGAVAASAATTYRICGSIMKTMRGVAEAGVRPDQQEQVREARRRWCRDGPACRCPARPRRGWRRPAPRSQPAIGMSVTWKPVPKMIASTSCSRAVGADDGVAAHLAGQAGGDDLDVGLARAPDSSRWRSGSACTRSVVRGQLAAAARGPRPGARRWRRAIFSAARSMLRAAGEADRVRLPRPVDRRAHGALQRRQVAIEPSARTRRRARSARGMTHGGVRWKRCSRSTAGWICGTNWIAEAPVPTTATRLPVRS